jgi:hypothetical protein
MTISFRDITFYFGYLSFGHPAVEFGHLEIYLFPTSK